MSTQTRPEKAQGRTRLIVAALHCMARFGQRGTTVRKIAELAGVTPGLVKHHFGSKDALLVATYRHLNESTVARIQTALTVHQHDPGQALDDAIAALFPDDLTDVHQMRVLVAFWGLVLTNPDFAAVQAATNAQSRKLFCALARLQVPSQAEAEEIANGIIAVTDGLWLECCMNPVRMTPAKAMLIAASFSRARLGLGAGDAG